MTVHVCVFVCESWQCGFQLVRAQVYCREKECDFSLQSVIYCVSSKHWGKWQTATLERSWVVCWWGVRGENVVMKWERKMNTRVKRRGTIQRTETRATLIAVDLPTGSFCDTWYDPVFMENASFAAAALLFCFCAALNDRRAWAKDELALTGLRTYSDVTDGVAVMCSLTKCDEHQRWMPFKMQMQSVQRSLESYVVCCSVMFTLVWPESRHWHQRWGETELRLTGRHTVITFPLHGFMVPFSRIAQIIVCPFAAVYVFVCVLWVFSSRRLRGRLACCNSMCYCWNVPQAAGKHICVCR